MTARISRATNITPGSVVSVMEIARRFFHPLPAVGRWEVSEARLKQDGWYVVLKELPDAEYRQSAFDVVTLAPMGYEPEMPELERYLAEQAAAMPPNDANAWRGDQL